MIKWLLELVGKLTYPALLQRIKDLEKLTEEHTNALMMRIERLERGRKF